MAQQQINVRDLIFQVSDGAAVPTWTQLGGLQEGGVNWGANEAVEDTTVWADNGNYSEEVMQRGAELSLKGRSLMDPATGVRDPGQAQVIANAAKVAVASKVQARFRYPGEPNWIVWACTVKRGEESGGTNNKVPFDYKFTRCGVPTTTPAP